MQPPVRSLLLPAALALAAGPLLADGDGTSAQAWLGSDAAVIGSPVHLAVRSPLTGSQAVLAFGFSPIPVVLGPAFPVLHVGAPFALPSGVIGSDGRLVATVPIAPAFPPGTEVYVQAAVIALSPFPTIHGSAAIRLSPGGGPAPFAVAGPSALPPSSGSYEAADVDWVDVNKDGFEDVFVANAGPAVPSLLINHAGTFTDEVSLRLPAAALIGSTHVEPGDGDGDGDLDLFLAGGFDTSAPAPNLLLRNNGAGFFSADAAFPPGAGRPLDAEFGDVDGDNDLDLVVANSQDPDQLGESPDGVELYLNTGGLFVPEASFSLLPATDPHTSGGSVSLGDVDNDGDLDLFIARADTLGGGLQNQLLLNDGLGTFADITAISIPPIIANSFEAEFADVNGDGRLDILLANSISSVPVAHHLLLNMGISPVSGMVFFNDGSFLMPASFGPATKVRTGLDVADVDGDGDPDAMYSIHQLFDDFGQLDGDAVLLLNQGGLQGGTLGAFLVDPSFSLPGGGFVCPDLAFGDADHDGDPDVYLGSTGDLFGAFPPQDILLLNGI